MLDQHLSSLGPIHSFISDMTSHTQNKNFNPSTFLIGQQNNYLSKYLNSIRCVFKEFKL